jgi:hypothetical protein
MSSDRRATARWCSTLLLGLRKRQPPYRSPPPCNGPEVGAGRLPVPRRPLHCTQFRGPAAASIGRSRRRSARKAAAIWTRWPVAGLTPGAAACIARDTLLLATPASQRTLKRRPCQRDRGEVTDPCCDRNPPPETQRELGRGSVQNRCEKTRRRGRNGRHHHGSDRTLAMR